MPHLIFVIDPLNPSCWDFHPIVKELRDQHAKKYQFSLVITGTQKSYPACKAIITVRELWGEEASFEYLEKIQEAFYAKGEDTTSLEILLKHVEDKEEFLAFYETPRAEILMHHDFAKARSMGANAFPSVVKIDSEGHMVCHKGYRGIEDILGF